MFKFQSIKSLCFHILDIQNYSTVEQMITSNCTRIHCPHQVVLNMVFHIPSRWWWCYAEKRRKKPKTDR